MEIEDEDNVKTPIEEADLDLDAEKILLTPEEILAQHKSDEDDDDDDDEEDEDKETYQEYEE